MSTGSTPSITPKPARRDDPEFDAFLAKFQARFLEKLADAKNVLFTTDAGFGNLDGMFGEYLDALPESERQYHKCHACRRFIETYGGLVTIDESGRARPALWCVDDAPPLYALAIDRLAGDVASANVIGVFRSSEKVWGTPVTGEWTHFAVTPPAAICHKHALQTAGQVMAEKKEDYRNVSRSLGEFTRPMLDAAMTLLQSESLYRSEKVIGPARWLRDLHAARDAAKGRQAKDNVVWLAVATAPAGFCHPRSSMVGTLLEDLAAGMDFDQVSRRFAAKMHPLQYQRPQAAPSAGNIAAAEKIVEKLGITRSLERRFARMDEVEAIWSPKAAKPEAPAGGVFGHLKRKGPAVPTMASPPAQVMTWEKFARTVLPTADAIEFYAAPKRDGYTALVTAVHADAPPIIQWDREDRQNPVSWYFWVGGSTPESFGLASGRFHKVNAVSLNPSQWGAEPGAYSHQGEGVLFVIDGAKDSRMNGSALFPEILKSELREVRATIEAYSRSAEIQGKEEASACGIMFMKGEAWDARLRVTAGGTTLEYKLDRWD